MSQEHLLKTWEPYYTDILEGRKTFDFRKNDRNFAVGDVLLLHRWPQIGPIPETFPVQVTYLVQDAPAEFGLPVGYCIMGIAKFSTCFAELAALRAEVAATHKHAADLTTAYEAEVARLRGELKIAKAVVAAAAEKPKAADGSGQAKENEHVK